MSIEGEDVKNSELCYVSKPQMRNKATKFAIETEKKTFSLILKIKDFVAFIILPCDFSLWL